MFRSLSIAEKDVLKLRNGAHSVVVERNARSAHTLRNTSIEDKDGFSVGYFYKLVKLPVWRDVYGARLSVPFHSCWAILPE